jgi:hypothetical protein
MNELEQRIYRDATKVAAEVTVTDIPPLRLSGKARHSSGRRTTGPHAMHWSGTGRGAVTKRILAPLAAAASVVVLIVVLITVGHGSSGARLVRPPVGPAKPSAADRALGAEALNWYFPASGATYTAGLAFAFTQVRVTAHDIDPCLAAAGFPQPAFRGSRRLYQLSFQNNSQFPDVAQLATSPGLHYVTRQYPVLRHPTAARQKAFARARARCTARYAEPVTRVDQAASTLQGTWMNSIAAIEHSSRVTATQPAFAGCLESHGVPASLAAETDNTASNPLFYGYFAWADSTNQAAATARELAADQRHETRVFVACAPRVLSALERIQLTRRAQFFHRHAAQIARITRLAEEMQAAHHSVGS